MSIREEMIDALEDLEDSLQDETGAPQKLILPSGAQLPCVPSTEEVGNTVAIGPLEQVITAMVRVRKELFITADLTNITADNSTITADNETPRLRSGKTPTFRTKTYRVLKYSEDPSGAYFKIFMGSAR